MSYPRPDSGQRPPMIRLDHYNIILGVRTDGEVSVWWPPGMSTIEARRWLDDLYVKVSEYLSEVSQPQPPRENPSPHYRPRRSPLANPATYDKD